MLLLTGCDYLNRVPEKDIETVESLFEQRTKAESWWKGLYGEVNTVLTSLTNNTSFLGADEFVTCQALYNSTTFRLDGLKVADGLQMSQSPYGSLWYKMYTVIRNANTFLENIDNTYNITDEDREWWKAESVYLFRVSASLRADLSRTSEYADGAGCECLSIAASARGYLFQRDCQVVR